MFGISVSTVDRVLSSTCVIVKFSGQPPQSGGKRKGMPDMLSVVPAIDGTSHEIQIPFNEHEQQFDNGHRKYYCIHTQVNKI